jgi:hypothetical protein
MARTGQLVGLLLTSRQAVNEDRQKGNASRRQMT